jgi:hypothetical protein
MPGVDGETVGDVEHRRRDGAEPQPLVDADRRTCVPALAKRDARGAERPGDDDDVPRPRAGSSGNAVGSSYRGDRDDDRIRTGRVASAHGDSRRGEPLVELAGARRA